MEFQTGIIHLVKSIPSVLNWVIQDLPNIKLVWYPTRDELINVVEADSFETYTYLVIGVKPKDISKDLIPNPDNYYFILLTDFEGKFNKEAEKAYKGLSGGCYKQVDLTKYNLLENTQITTLIANKGLLPKQAEQLITDLPDPFRVYWQLQQTNVLDYETCCLEKEAIPLIQSLLTNEGISKWSKLGKRHAYALFLCNEITSAPMYLILAGNPKNTKQFGLCPALWVYLDMMFSALLSVYEHNPQYILMLFASWVRLASTKWATVNHPGFKCTVYNSGKSYYTFDPSIEAHTAFKELLF
jgi:hypothetical protein